MGRFDRYSARPAGSRQPGVLQAFRARHGPGTRTGDTTTVSCAGDTGSRSILPGTRESSRPAGFRRVRWRDPDSNRGHHDFQSLRPSGRAARNPCKREILASWPRAGDLREIAPGPPRVFRGWQASHPLFFTSRFAQAVNLRSGPSLDARIRMGASDSSGSEEPSAASSNAEIEGEADERWAARIAAVRCLVLAGAGGSRAC